MKLVDLCPSCVHDISVTYFVFSFPHAKTQRRFLCSGTRYGHICCYNTNCHRHYSSSRYQFANRNLSFFNREPFPLNNISSEARSSVSRSNSLPPMNRKTTCCKMPPLFLPENEIFLTLFNIQVRFNLNSNNYISYGINEWNFQIPDLCSSWVLNAGNFNAFDGCSFQYPSSSAHVNMNVQLSWNWTLAHAKYFGTH